jgi:hypothetical protein
MRTSRVAAAAALAAALAAAGVAEAAPARRPAAPTRGDARVEVDRAGRVHVVARQATLGRALKRLGAATGVAMPALPPHLARAPVTLDAGPAPLERVVRQLLRPHGVALVFGPRQAGSRALGLVVIPAGAAVPRTSPAASAPPPGAAGADEEAPPEEAEVMALGRSLDDLQAVARLQVIADGRSGLGPEHPARLLARRLLETLPGGVDEDDPDEAPEAVGDADGAPDAG